MPRLIHGFHQLILFLCDHKNSCGRILPCEIMPSYIALKEPYFRQQTLHTSLKFGGEILLHKCVKCLFQYCSVPSLVRSPVT